MFQPHDRRQARQALRVGTEKMMKGKKIDQILNHRLLRDMLAKTMHEIWVETDGTVHWAVNRTELDITGSVNNLMDAAAHYLIFGQAQSVTGAAVIVVEIDWIENEKTKAH